MALKSNIAYDALAILNLAFEMQVHDKMTVELPVMWSLWDMEQEHGIRTVALQPEARWWTGSEVYVLVDDYDLVSTSRGNPLRALVPYLAQASDLGLHVVVARRTGGASRAMYDPVLQTFHDLGMTGILLSGDPNEGQLIGKVKPKKAAPGRAQIVTRDQGLFVAQLSNAVLRE